MGHRYGAFSCGRTDEFPLLTDPCKSGLVGQLASGLDVPLVPIQRLGRLNGEVVAELVIAELARTDDDLVCGHVVDACQQRAQQRQPDCLLRSLAGDRLRVVPAGRVSGHQQRLVADDSVDERQQDIEDVVRTSDRLGSGGPPHAREVQVDPPVSGERIEHRVQAGHHLAVVDPGAVQSENR